MDMDNGNADALNIRLKVFMDSTGLNNSQFADRCRLPRPSFSQILSGRNKKVSDVVLTRIHDAFPQLNMLWLMFGEGPMLNGNDSAVSGVSVEDDGNTPAQANNRDGYGLGELRPGQVGVANGQSTPRPYPLRDEEDSSSFAVENYNGDNRKFPAGGQGATGFHRENGPLLPLSSAQEADIERISSMMAAKISGDLQHDLRKVPRKVVRITVFYDDNSYETFAPTSEPLG